MAQSSISVSSTNSLVITKTPVSSPLVPVSLLGSSNGEDQKEKTITKVEKVQAVLKGIKQEIELNIYGCNTNSLRVIKISCKLTYLLYGVLVFLHISDNIRTNFSSVCGNKQATLNEDQMHLMKDLRSHALHRTNISASIDILNSNNGHKSLKAINTRIQEKKKMMNETSYLKNLRIPSSVFCVVNHLSLVYPNTKVL
ncbi:hypothetical protein Fmac_028435 [Flemingia macrophylla]|uniref:ATP synthase protein MI25 n=1 Tax=Flemingia macrophylla TaxID=520843 RepID=A0ABD1L7I6_9FABA